MDFNKTIIFKKKSFADLLSEIYDNSRTKEKQISELIHQLKPMIKEVGDAMLIVPLLKEYLELSIKNDEHLIKMAGIVQRAMTMASENGGDLILTDQEKEALVASVSDMKRLN